MDATHHQLYLIYKACRRLPDDPARESFFKSFLRLAEERNAAHMDQFAAIVAEAVSDR